VNLKALSGSTVVAVPIPLLNELPEFG